MLFHLRDRRGVIDDEPVWRGCRPGFFLPARVLGAVFRGKFLAGQAVQSNSVLSAVLARRGPNLCLDARRIERSSFGGREA